MVKPRLPRKRAASAAKSKGRKSRSGRRRHRGKGLEDASIEDLGGFLAEHASEDEMLRELERLRAEDDELLVTVRRKAKAAGLTRKKVRDLLDEVKKEVWNRTYGNKSPRK